MCYATLRSLYCAALCALHCAALCALRCAAQSISTCLPAWPLAVGPRICRFLRGRCRDGSDRQMGLSRPEVGLNSLTFSPGRLKSGHAPTHHPHATAHVSLPTLLL